MPSASLSVTVVSLSVRMAPGLLRMPPALFGDLPPLIVIPLIVAFDPLKIWN